MPFAMKFAALAAVLVICTSVSADPVILQNDKWRVEIDPATLAVNATTPDGKKIAISSAAGQLAASDLHSNATTANWKVGDVTVAAENYGTTFKIHFDTQKPGEITWPVLRPTTDVKGLILPTDEGAYVPLADADWRKFLVAQSPMDTTSGLVMPFWGIDLGDATLSYILLTPYNNQLTFADEKRTLAAHLTHEFTPNQATKSFGIAVLLTTASPIAPAKAYREYLKLEGRLTTLRDKIQRTPKAERLLGAAHVYLWGDALLSRYDVPDWKALAQKLESDDAPAKAIFARLNRDAQKQVHEMTTAGYQSDYARTTVAAELSKCPITTLVGALPNLLDDPKTWGDGVSTKFLNQLHDAGLDRLCITTGDLNSAADKPLVAARAEELGYLFGPYDSYDAVHRPGETETWQTAQFDQALYDSGAVLQRNGTKKTGFKKKGYLLNPTAAQPYVEKRVNGLESRVPFSSWFVDCDAFGNVYDDYSPAHPLTQEQFAQARINRLNWIAKSHSLVIGSEGGSAFAASSICFAHGMMTPVIGWGDPDLTGKSSRYYLGRYYPPDGPEVFVKQVPLKPSYAKMFYDPRYRLPLYETVFHDSVIATHHWSTASLKFSDQVLTTELLEQLYNVPPLYHLNIAELAKHRDRIIAHQQFFTPLHRQIATEPLTDFSYLTPDHLVQRTVFGDRVELVANFTGQHFASSAGDVPPRSVLFRNVGGDGEVRIFSPKP